MIYNIYDNVWDVDFCDILNILFNLLFEVKDSVDEFGMVKVEWFGCELFILGVVGD